MQDILSNCLSQGERIRDLFAGATSDVVVVAPFIKEEALRSLLTVVPERVAVRCVTRWRSREVAAGVSDPQIIYLLATRGNSELYLVDNLHAKLYMAGPDCLVGSANVTRAGLGEVEDHSIELLVEARVDNPAVETVLEEIALVQRKATEEMAKSVIEIAGILADVDRVTPAGAKNVWFPRSPRASDAYRVYSRPFRDFVKTSDRVLLMDVARGNLQPGLASDDFRREVRGLLKEIAIAEQVLKCREEEMLTFADARTYLDCLADEQFSPFDLWRAFVAWMAEFFPEQVVSKVISEVALRRGRLLE